MSKSINPNYRITLYESTSRFWKRALKFSGRATRSEFNYVVLWHLLISIALLSPCVMFFDSREEAHGFNLLLLLLLIPAAVWQAVTLVPFLTLWVRRGHDFSTDTFSSIVMFFFPVMNFCALITSMIMDSDKGQNKYGDSQKYPEKMKEASVEANFIGKTRSAVSSVLSETKFCPRCGNKIGKASAFCPHCGGKQPVL